MFEWLDQEIEAVKTRRFYVVDGPADDSLRKAIEERGAALPRSYQEFSLRFGNAKLYKELGYYIVGVRAAPVEEQSTNGEELDRIGHYQSSNAYFKGSTLHGEGEAPVFEEGKGRLFKVADGFEEWRRKRCKAARAKYNKREWAEVLAGPAPFTAEEQAIIEARRLFTCKLAGVNTAGNIFFKVHNGSEMVLPFLSVSVRWKESKRGHFETGVWLPVAYVRPGQTIIVEHHVHNGLADSEKIEVNIKSDPEPEDRERYWEFKAFAR